MIRILLDGASDYPLEELQNHGLELVNMTVTMNGKDYIEGENLKKDEFYEILETTTLFPKTSQPSPQAFLNIFEDVKKKKDEMICILLSSKLSGTYQSARLAKDMVEYDGIYLIDSLLASCTIKILADEACRLVKDGQNISVIVGAIEALKKRVKVIAALDTLEYLYRGGRLTKTAATIGEIAKIKPVITLSEDGQIEILSKCFGKNKAMNYMMKHLERLELDSNFPLYSIYTYGIENCEKWEEKLKAKFKEPNQRIQIGATIGTHVGPNAFGLVYVKGD